MLIRDLMTPDPVIVRPETPVEDIAGLLLAHRINGVPVVDENRRLLGVVTAADLIHRAADERLEPRESLWKENFWISFLSPEGTHPGKAEGHTAAEVMTREVHSVAPDDPPGRGCPVDGAPPPDFAARDRGRRGDRGDLAHRFAAASARTRKPVAKK